MTRYRIVYQNTSLEAREGIFLVGRSPDCHLVLDDPSISRVHCAIVLEKGVLYGEDKGSRNGITVNGMLVEGRRRLKDGDIISLGRQSISIVSVENEKISEHTQGLNRCKGCGSWIPSFSSECSHCGPSKRTRGKRHLKATHAETPSKSQRDPRSSVIERHPIVMLAGLALKAIRVDKTDEAMRLIANAISSVNDRLDREGKISDEEFDAVVEALLSLAENAKSASSISDLFDFHLRAGRLMSRDHVQKLYDVVRPTGYRMCPTMTRYLTYLDGNEKSFTPGQRFIHKRVKGLVSLCS